MHFNIEVISKIKCIHIYVKKISFHPQETVSMESHSACHLCEYKADICSFLINVFMSERNFLLFFHEHCFHIKLTN